MRRLTIFCHYDKDNIIDDYVVYWIKYMNKLSDIIFISDNDLEDIELEKINYLVIKSIAFRHKGMGATSVKIAYEYAYNNNLLINYDWLFIVNDSIYGPFFDIEPFILRQEKRKKIAYGFTKALLDTENEHIQSTFIAIPKDVFLSNDFLSFISSIKEIKNKNIERETYEYGMSKIIRKIGYKLEGFFDDKEYHGDIYIKYEPVRPAFIDMIKEGYPFVRRTIFTKNYYYIENLNDYLELENIISKECFDNMIKHMNRVINKDELNISINYPWIRQYLREKEEIIQNYYLVNFNYNIELFEKKTFIEKINWIKIYYNDPLMLKCIDKYLVREYIEEKIGYKYLLPIINIYNNYAEIISNFNIYEYNESFIIASTINEDYYIINDKSEYNNEKIHQLSLDLININNNQYLKDLQWCYKYIKPRILIYKYIEKIYKSNKRYKVLCFNSEPKVIKVTVEDNHKKFSNFYDLNWTLLDLKQKYEIYNEKLEKPLHFNEMLGISKKLSQEFPYFVAIDFIDTDEQLYFEKYDFYSNDLLYPLSNEFYNIEWGNMIANPNIVNEYFIMDKDVISRTFSLFEKDYFYKKETLNNYLNIVDSLNNELNNCRNIMSYLKSSIIIKNNKNEDLKLNINWFSLLSIFGIQLFSISNNSNYLRLTVLGIKLTFKVNEESINKIAWWIPIKSLRNNFRNRFNIN